MSETYLPLPSSITISKSKIHGLGLIALEDIPKGTNLGITMHKIFNQFIRSPIGGFLNHSITPNCKCITKEILLPLRDCLNVYHKKETSLVTDRDIKAGEELTVTYNMYNPIKKEVK